MKKKISVILPTYNEAENIINLIEKIINNIPADYDYEILVIDDNSPDQTLLKVNDKFKNNPFIKSILRTKDKGFAKSIRNGIEISSGELIIVMDSDLTHDPIEIPKLIRVAEIFDLVSCSRFCAGGRMKDLFHYFSSFIYNLFLRLLLHTQVQDNLGGYFAISKNKINNLPFDLIFFGYGDYYFRLIYFCQKAGYSIIELPSIYLMRSSGKSKSNWLAMIAKYTIAAISLKVRR